MGSVYLNGGYSFDYGFNCFCARTSSIHDINKHRRERMEINNINLNDMASKIRKNISKKSKAPLMPEIELKDFVRAKKEGYSALLRFDKMDNEKLIINYRDCAVYCLLNEIENYELGKQCETVVVDIDEEKREVWVSSKKSKERFLEKKESETRAVGNAIIKEMMKGKTLIYPAKVKAKFRDGRGVMLSILGTNVVGRLMAQDWSVGYMESLNGHVEVGDWLDVEIIGKISSKSNPYFFKCSRVNITPNPWNNKLAERYKKGDFITVQCISKEEEKDYWWGVNPEIDGLQIMCDYTQNLNIVKGHTYRCYIKKINVDKHKFVVVPIDEISNEYLSESCIFRKLEN